MSPVERRQALLEVLCRRRSDTYANLAFEFGVSKKTIQRDVEILICSYPIETVLGDYPYDCHTSKRALNCEQTELLVRIRKMLSGKDIDTLDSIITGFAP